jgi:hypothetical protein
MGKKGWLEIGDLYRNKSSGMRILCIFTQLLPIGKKTPQFYGGNRHQRF